MNLSPYVDLVQRGLTTAAELADDHTRHVAERLGSAIEPATRMALLRALSDAAAQISAELAPASVGLRMEGADPEFVVSVPPEATDPERLTPPPEPPSTDEDEDLAEEPLARVSLRLPASLKAKVDELAEADGISANAWLIRAVGDAIADRRRGAWPPPPPPFGGGVFGPHGPFGPNGVFSPRGWFAGGGTGPQPHHEGRSRDSRRDDRDADRTQERGGRRAGPGGVQGWAR